MEGNTRKLLQCSSQRFPPRPAATLPPQPAPPAPPFAASLFPPPPHTKPNRGPAAEGKAEKQATGPSSFRTPLRHPLPPRQPPSLAPYPHLLSSPPPPLTTRPLTAGPHPAQPAVTRRPGNRAQRTRRFPLRPQQRPLRRAILLGPALALAHTPSPARARARSRPASPHPGPRPAPAVHILRSHWLPGGGGAGLPASLPLRLGRRGGARAPGRASKPLLSRWRLKKKYPSARLRGKESASPPTSTKGPETGPNGKRNMF